MNHPPDRVRRQPARRHQAQRRRVADQADRRDAPASGGTHNFQATIEALSLMTDSLPTSVSGWLVRGLRGIVQAIALMVKQQWAQRAAPPNARCRLRANLATKMIRTSAPRRLFCVCRGAQGDRPLH